MLQNFLVKDKINDKAFMKKQIKCFLEDVGCDEFGKKAMGRKIKAFFFL